LGDWKSGNDEMSTQSAMYQEEGRRRNEKEKKEGVGEERRRKYEDTEKLQSRRK